MDNTLKSRFMNHERRFNSTKATTTAPKLIPPMIRIGSRLKGSSGIVLVGELVLVGEDVSDPLFSSNQSEIVSIMSHSEPKSSKSLSYETTLSRF